jgi:hypothetical protein
MLRFPQSRHTKIIRQTALPSALSAQIIGGTNNDKTWLTLDIDLTTASEFTRFDITGSGLWLMRATNAAGVVSNSAQLWLKPRGTGSWLPFRSILGYEPAFTFVEAKWSSFPGITATLLYLREGSSDGRVMNP